MNSTVYIIYAVFHSLYHSNCGKKKWNSNVLKKKIFLVSIIFSPKYWIYRFHKKSECTRHTHWVARRTLKHIWKKRCATRRSHGKPFYIILSFARLLIAFSPSLLFPHCNMFTVHSNSPYLYFNTNRISI